MHRLSSAPNYSVRITPVSSLTTISFGILHGTTGPVVTGHNAPAGGNNQRLRADCGRFFFSHFLQTSRFGPFLNFRSLPIFGEDLCITEWEVCCASGYSEIRVGRVSVFVSIGTPYLVLSSGNHWYGTVCIIWGCRKVIDFNTSYHYFVNDYRTTQKIEIEMPWSWLEKVYWILLNQRKK